MRESMGDYAILQIGLTELPLSKWDLPIEEISILNLIFKPEDLYKVTLREEERDPEERGPRFKWIYKTDVKEAKRRLNQLHLSRKEIDVTVSKIVEVGKKDAALALLSEDDFGNRYGYDDPSDKIWERRERALDKMRKHNLGNLAELRHIRKKLDDASNYDDVVLDLSQIHECNTRKKVERSKLISEEHTQNIRLERKCLEMAKVHFTTGEHDLVYIYLIIALEQAIHRYIYKKHRELRDFPSLLYNIESDMSLVNLIKFTFSFVGRRKIDPELLEEVIKVYNKRNTIAHQGCKSFNLLEVASAIRTIEQFITQIKKLK